MPGFYPFLPLGASYRESAVQRMPLGKSVQVAAIDPQRDTFAK